MNPNPTRRVLLLVACLVAAAAVTSTSSAQGTDGTVPAEWTWDASDPRIGLAPGISDAGEAAWNARLVAHRDKPEGFGGYDAELSTGNTDLAFRGNLVFVGNYRGFNVYDVSDAANPVLQVSVVCPGGQGDLSVHGDLLFMSVEETRGRIDCGTQGVAEAVSAERFRGVRIFDISEIDTPRQVAAVQTCRGSHTHSLVPDPADDRTMYVYVSGIGPVRSAEELAGCSGAEDDASSLFRIEVIRVPLDAPSEAAVVNAPRIFADRESGDVAGLWPGGTHGPGTQASSRTDQCHDITAYAEIGLAGGACSGNGIVLDIRDPANPARIDEVIDENFAYWHSATFTNDGTKLLFTDEWGGGGAARCRASDPADWGANAIFELTGGKLRLAGYYKLPVPQTEAENCVAHNGSIVPVPGRDIIAQAWYQGGLSVLDFTDPANPFEIAFFDRGPILADDLVLGGYWSTYWYNGYIYGTEIVRGLDVLELLPSEHLTQNELDAAKLAVQATFNPQDQQRVAWPDDPVVARAYADQLVRAGAMTADAAAGLSAALDAGDAAALNLSADALEAAALAALSSGRAGNPAKVQALLAETLRGMAGR